MVYGFTYFTTGVSCRLVRNSYSNMVQARATQVQTAYSIERHGVLFHKCFSQASRLKLQGGYNTSWVSGHAL